MQLRDHIREKERIPAWVKKGQTVNYFCCSKCEKPHLEGKEIISRPWLIGGVWCVKIRGKSGGVSIGYLEKAGKEGEAS